MTTTAKQIFRTPKLVYTLLIGIFLLIVVIDAGTTSYLVENHPAGINVEGNPFVKVIISEYGWVYMVFIKLVGFICIAIAALSYAKKHQYVSLVNIGLIMMLTIAIGVQLHNLYHIESLL
ncbi:MAG: DUF5658 family protein [Nitrososphaerales archaeon]